jgi:hypothetical protein
MSKLSVFEDYKSKFQILYDFHGTTDYQPFSYSAFFKLWKSEFPYVTVPKHQAFSMCEICAQLHDRILLATKQHDRKALLDLKKLRRIHIELIADERLEYREHQRLAIEEPDRFVSMVLDGMDQAKLRGPHFAGGSMPKGMFRSVSFYCSYLNKW